ncbi:cytochrome b-245 light chain-like [Mercenaria mercenaria]|uniref:cytochrome b-245 light chain-like n=1 Tax=Mercenaria mercenaria TaxID=6596 RepID=UPI00234E3A3C|nr:cytochrome b-245 light chain-like [Mercenaria mercenaria]
MSQIEWAMWANEQALTSCSVLLLGSAVDIAGMFNRWQFGIYGLIASLFILVIEWPRSKRKKGSTVLRRFQRPFTLAVDKLGLLGRNYFIRFIAYLLMCIPCCFTLATLLGGVCLLCTGGIYFLAAIKGEEWAPAGLDEKSQVKRVTSLHPPKKAPPRPNTRDVESVGTENIDMEIVEETGQPTERSKPTRPPPRPMVVSRDGIQDTSR